MVILVAVFSTSASLKLWPDAHAQTLFSTHRGLALAIAGSELLLAIALAVPATRRRAAVVATLVLAAGAAFVAIRPALQLPTCGCFGGYLATRPQWHLVICGVGLLLLADLVHSTRIRVAS